MLKMPTFLGLAALIAAGAVVNGAVTQRWNVFVPDRERTDRLHAAEVRFEDWTSEPVDTEMPPNEGSTATSRRYLSPKTGQSAAVTFISGPPGSVSTHTPDICYPGAGYKTLRGAHQEAVELPGGVTGQCYAADFEKTKLGKKDRARVRWAWTTDGQLVAPDSPRWQFAKKLASVPVLYKIYIVTPLPEADADAPPPEDDAVTKAFVRSAWAQYAAIATP